MRLRRSMMFIPGANAGMLSNSYIYKPDSVMFDLEDSVSLTEKDSARFLVFNTLKENLYGDIETVVRINGVETPFWEDDLDMAVRAGVQIVRLPKTETVEEVKELEQRIAKIEKDCGRTIGDTKIMAAIESACGVVNSVAIAKSTPRMVAIALAGFDYLVDMQTSRSSGSEPELFYARAAVLHAARAAKIDAFDVAYGNVNDEEGFLREVEIAKNLGYNGKSLIHPRQIELLHKAYAPAQKDVDHARKVVAAAEDAEKKGLGVISLDGKMIDPPVVHEAQRVLLLAEHS
ncbi:MULTISPECIES: aldolase/citrate lyase family protein [Gluconobacter]|uniref:Citrate lyase subunit beta n=1 Tax=Gluconobacter kondonii TaxID=941463 RepID=A0ABQ5WT78_9PROT|nr:MULTISPECIES: aldolase/citrate lyase family protein [Gluconobacter]AQS92336.1 citrate lyase subunit beta [Gluconobacter albidus]MBF0891717.1 HpcH/HpaI aldolase/citrate lyase family protein [Gluconobacter cadivus]MBN3868406.1 HpcH/HpaI aldolase/citrate lyase family protein [Gluconobacter kondonii]MBS1053792.1 HpcH/HpaI aldolase/citrate lyase family protein [Gluconobacter kondonii]MBS1058016.1 HpcH/HpaI aldolase/citrate lyase family protein [Gluconobacter kondonii]